MIINMRDVGKRCKQYRIDHGYYQSDVARDLNYSHENISAFENGRNDNASILLWYFAHGMKYEHLFDGSVKYGERV